ncbi:MAG: hypothetical protein RIS70_585 [Planctomycetota bacterium]|jgi:glycolate oxidase FAD binding subunit
MATVADMLTITERVAPREQTELAEHVAVAHASGTAVYPLGGSTSLGMGIPGKIPGIGLELSGLDRVVDYPARDMTITVEAGIRLETLAKTLRAEGQELPVDAPQTSTATVGGLIATNLNGPRRYGHGAIRDYVIGIRAVDGRGETFQGGGRVVKNVAGYDFCKLLTGSMGTLGVITQLTLKVRPLPEQRLVVAAYPSSLQQVENVLATVERSVVTPVAMTLLSGPEAISEPLDAAYPLALVFALEGTAAETEWLDGELRQLLRDQGIDRVERVVEHADRLWNQIVDFPAKSGSPLVVKVTVVPSGVVAIIPLLRELDPHCSIIAHAGAGSLLVRFSRIPEGGLSRTLVARLQSAAAQSSGHVQILSNPGNVEATRQATWGAGQTPMHLMSAVKKQFDPRNILNPGRFIFP